MGGSTLERLRGFGLHLLAIAVILQMLAIVAQVLCGAFDINPIIAFERALPLVGKAVTLNSLLDLQWHLLVMIGLLPVGIVWAMDRHVRVDFIYLGQTERVRARINLVGNLVFAAPFFFLMLPAAWAFMRRAWTSGEGSASGGLNDLWLIKAVLPFGLALLALAVVIETLRQVRRVR